MKILKFGLSILTTVFLAACGGGGVPSDPEVRDYSDTFKPLPSNAIYPVDNPFSLEKEKLGELLFWDPILSGDQNTSCASCHHPDFGWADGRRFSVGSDGIGLGPNRQGKQVTPIHSPSVMNVAFTGIANTLQPNFSSGPYFWDLRADSLAEQALGPIKNPVEMLGYNVSEEQALSEIVTRLSGIPEYVTLFEQAFGNSSAITSENIAKSIATFQRKIISPNSRFDKFLAGEISALSQQEIIGLNKFIDGGCSRCHSGPMLADNQIHDGEAVINDKVVRTPTLRNITLTAPYMHDGSRATLRDAIAAYDDRGDLDVNIGGGDFGDIETFLKTLTTTDFYNSKPDRVPSGLPVGGEIN